MAVYKLFPTQDATLYSLYPTMNSGLDAILEASNILGTTGTPDVSRYLIQFDTTEIVDIIDNKINGNTFDVYLKNSITEAQGINTNTTLEIRPVAQEWNNGTGYFLDSPIVTDGTSWDFSTYSSMFGLRWQNFDLNILKFLGSRHFLSLLKLEGKYLISVTPEIITLPPHRQTLTCC